MSQLRTCLDEHQVVFLGLVFTLLSSDLPFIIQVRLVADKHDDDVVSSFGTHIIYPFLRILEGLSIYHVELVFAVVGVGADR